MLNQTGAVLKTAAEVQIGDTLVTELAENLIESRVIKK
jgi:ribosomal 50S subunit-recycling heat shock protein